MQMASVRLSVPVGSGGATRLISCAAMGGDVCGGYYLLCRTLARRSPPGGLSLSSSGAAAMLAGGSRMLERSGLG
jgi:hypothetical protein